MTDAIGLTADAAAKQARDSELVQLKTQVDRLKGDLTPTPSKQQKLRKACTDFEAVFIGKLWEQMRNTVPKEGFLHSSQEDMYRSMFDKDFSEKLASDGGIGLGDMLYRQLKDRIKATGKEAPTGGAAAADKAASQPDASQVQAQTQVPASGPPKLQPLARKTYGMMPAPVPGSIMPEVEDLARRIEAAGVKKTAGQQGALKIPGRGLAITG